MMKHLTVFAFGIAGTLLFSGCNPPKPAAMPVPKVTVAYAQTAIVTNWDEFPAHIEAVESVEIRPRVSGYIESIHFEEGAEVKAGDLLYIIDPKPYQAELDRTAAERQRAESRLELTQNDLKRAESLRGTKAISEEEYDSRSKVARETLASLLAAKAAESVAQLNVNYTRVKAPVNGRIGRRLVTVGNLVQGGGAMPATLLTTLVSLDPVYCSFDVDEPAFRRYRTNAMASGNTVALACELALAGEEGFPHKGTVNFFDNQLNPKTGTILLRSTFPNADRSLVPGMFATVRVPAGPPEPALLVPAVGIGTDQGNKFVLLVGASNIVQPQPVKVGRQHGTNRAVLSGLTTNDPVIVNGLMMARPGAMVEVTKPAPAVATNAPQGRP